MIKIAKFYTSEYYLAVTLLALGEILIDVEKDANSPRATFSFQKSPTIEKNIEDFRCGKILIEPTTLFLQHKLLKGRLYNL